MHLLDNEPREALSVAVLGQQGGGKSTLVGHLRHQCGFVAQRELEELTRESTDAEKPSLDFAWLSDRRGRGGKRGMTIDATDALLHTRLYDLNLIDTPGSRSYIKHAIAGAATADHALLVVDARHGAYESGMTEEGCGKGELSTTKELALAAFAMGVRELIVVVNKMEEVAFAQTRFDAIQGELAAHLGKIGFQGARIQYVPVSGRLGENLVHKSNEHMPWYSGLTLLEAIDQLTLPVRAIDKPLRMPVQDVYKVAGSDSVVLTGRIQTGVVRRGTFVSVNGHKGTVCSIESHHRQLRVAYAGTTVGVRIKGLSGRIARGDVLSDPNCDEATPVSHFIARLVFVRQPASKNKSLSIYTPVVYCHTAHVRCYVEKITGIVDRQTGHVKTAPSSDRWQDRLEAHQGDACDVLFHVCGTKLEAFREYAQLGRIVVRDSGATVAVGVVRAVKRDDTWRGCETEAI